MKCVRVGSEAAPWNGVDVTRRGGFALLATLWLVVAFGVIGLEWGLRAKELRRVAMNTADSATARAAAESGLAQARARLAEALRQNRDSSIGEAVPPLDPWRDLALAVPDSTGRYGDALWWIQLEDVGSKLDLNSADPDELRKMIIALRIDAGQANVVAQSVADWRDPDDAHRPQGAEREWYAQMDRPVMPRNGPFQDVTELRHVRGVTEEVYEKVAPYLSVRGTGRINLVTAPREVLLALPGLGEEAVATLERRRRDGQSLSTLLSLSNELSTDARQALVDALPQLVARTTAETQAVRIISEGRVEHSPLRVRVEALVVRDRDDASVVWQAVTP